MFVDKPIHPFLPTPMYFSVTAEPMHKNQSEGCFCRNMSEKRKEKKEVALVSNESIQKLYTHIFSGNYPQVLQLLFYRCGVGLLSHKFGSW